MSRVDTTPFRECVRDMHDVSAAFRVDAINGRMTGATIVLDPEAADELANMLRDAAYLIDTLLPLLEGRTS